jgi:hypothetical protein
MKNLINKIILVLICCLVVQSCKKDDWRDAFIGSYVATYRYELPITDFLTGLPLSYNRDTIFDTNVNLQLSKNDLTDQIKINVNGVYFMDADKDGFGPPKKEYRAYFGKDSVVIAYKNLTDTILFGRFTYVGFRN